MWREEVGITEMILTYLGEFLEFDGWPSWRTAVIEILSCHEQFRLGKIIVTDPRTQETTFDGGSTDNILEDENSMMIEKFVIENEIQELNSNELQGGHSVSGGIPETSTSMESNQGSVEVKEEENDLEIIETHNIRNYDEMTSIVDAEEEHNMISIGTLSHSQQHQLRNSHSLLGRESSSATTYDSAFRAHFSGEFTREDATIRRYKKPNDPELVCNICNGTFETPYLYDRHMMSHTSKLTFRCKFCHIEFPSYAKQKAHELLHNGKKRYKCSFCEKTFADSSNKGKHERIHTGEKPYSCRFCSKSFNQIPNRMRHEMTHNR